VSISSYARGAARLVDQGYSVLPVAPSTKVPGAYRDGQWHPMYGWTRFCSRSPTDLEIRIWSTWPDAGVCVCMGPASGNLVALDIDVEDFEIWQVVESVAGESVVEKRGRAGYTSFWRAPATVVSTKFSIGKKTIVDLLASGKESVIPPSTHPDTGRPYEWLRGSLEHISPERLPELPGGISELIAEALQPFGHMPPRPKHGASDTSGIWADVNAAALSNLDAWAPALGVPYRRKPTGGYRLVATWRAGDDYNVSLDQRGIMDFSHDGGLSAIDLASRALGCSPSEAESWLRNRVVPKLERVEFKFSGSAEG
jgi:hypothetical protein